MEITEAPAGENRDFGCAHELGAAKRRARRVELGDPAAEFVCRNQFQLGGKLGAGGGVEIGSGVEGFGEGGEVE